MKAAVERIEEYSTRPLEETAASIKACGKTFRMFVLRSAALPLFGKPLGHDDLGFG